MKIVRQRHPERFPLATFHKWIEECRDKPFDFRQGPNSALDVCDCCCACTRNEEDLHELFCVEFVAAAYQRCGLLPPHPSGQPASEYSPAEFTPDASGITSAVSVFTGCCCIEWYLRRTFSCLTPYTPFLERDGMELKVGHPDWMKPKRIETPLDFVWLAHSGGINTAATTLFASVCCIDASSPNSKTSDFLL